MASTKLPVIALVWAQYAAYHVDRCEAVGKRLSGMAKVRAIELASTSTDYAWEASGETVHAEKQTLFPGKKVEDISHFARLKALYRAVRDCDWVLMGIPYSEPEAIALSWLLRAKGVRVVMMTDSKADDTPRSAWKEWIKRIILLPYRAAIVGGRRSEDYAHSLGFLKRPVLPGYDGVGLERIRAVGETLATESVGFSDRPFIFVGRFVEKKNLGTLLRGFAHYVQRSGGQARKLVLAGYGPLSSELYELANQLGIAEKVEFTGFLTAEEVARRLSGALALVLVSTVEQWGLVVNEALAFGLPAIVSTPVGSRDALVRHCVNGCVVDPASASEIGDAMALIANCESDWLAMVAASHERAWMGDVDRFVDALELLINPVDTTLRTRIELFRAAMRDSE